jgi:hypothetical protein
MAVFPRFLPPLVLIVALAACKGGGSSGGGTDLPPITPGGSGTLGSYYVLSFSPWESVAQNLRASARYARQHITWYFPSAPGTDYESNPLAAARVEYAHAVGLTGKGQTIAVADGGFRTTHRVFAGKTVTTVGTVTTDDQSAMHHGTMVASIAAGDSPGMIGVAPGADLLLGQFDSDLTMAALADAARAAGAVALNNSWGYSNTPVSGFMLNSFLSDPDWATYHTALTAYAQEGVVVFALSNDENLTVSDLMPALPLVDAGIRDGWIAVGNAVADFNNTQILSVTRLSAPCLEAAKWCIVADGSWEAATAAGNNSYEFGTGSSFAAPQVAGALALLAEAFPDLTPHQLRVRLLASADNDFAGFDIAGTVLLAPGFHHNYSDEFGHGFLNVKAALMPIGTTTLSVDGQAVPLGEAMVRSGSGVGDAVARGLAAVDLTVRDSLAGSFAMPGEVLAPSARPARLSARLAEAGRSAVSPGEEAVLSGAQGFGAYDGTELALTAADAPLMLGLLVSEGGAGSLGLSVTRRFGDDRSGLDLGLKLARDGGEVFGLGGNRSGGGAVAASVTLGLRGALGENGFVRLSAEAGLAGASGNGALTHVGQMGFDSFGAEIGQSNLFAANDRFSVGLATPVGVTSGQAHAALPLRDANGITQFSDVAIPLSPDEREVDLKISYQVPLSGRTDLRLDLVHAANYGNRAGETETAGALTIRFVF